MNNGHIHNELLFPIFCIARILLAIFIPALGMARFHVQAEKAAIEYFEINGYIEVEFTKSDIITINSCNNDRYCHLKGFTIKDGKPIEFLLDYFPTGEIIMEEKKQKGDKNEQL